MSYLPSSAETIPASASPSAETAAPHSKGISLR